LPRPQELRVADDELANKILPMSSMIQAYAAPAAGKPLQPFEYQPGPLGAEEVEIAVEYCGICHSDLSMIDNEWGMSAYPLVAGHEVVGRVVAAGPQAKRVTVGDRVGLGWSAGSCLSCPQCLSGRHNLCGSGQPTIVGRHGGFANRVRCHWVWAAPMPEAVSSSAGGPLLCGGITVFSPMVEFEVKPTDRVGVVGIGGLGHMAIRFLNKWGCEVTAFTSSEKKLDEAKGLGAHHAVSSTDSAAIARLAGSLDFIMVTVNVPLDWSAYIAALAPRGRIHFVGAVLKPIEVGAFSLIMGQRSVSGSPIGSPATVDQMLAFCARHQIAPVVEEFPMSRINDALEHLRAGKARYRIALKNDLG
jgi:alcohol/geraniol dehydrogenase (NADP+)